MARFAIVSTFQIAHGQMDAFLPILWPTNIAASRMSRARSVSTDAAETTGMVTKPTLFSLLAPRVGP